MASSARWAAPLRAALATPRAVPSLRRTYASAPKQGAQSLRTQLAPLAPPRAKPSSPTYYTTDPAYHDSLQLLDQLTRELKRELEQTHVLAPQALPPALPMDRIAAFTSRRRVAMHMGLSLRVSQFRDVSSRLLMLARYKELAVAHFGAGAPPQARITRRQRDLTQQVVEVLAAYTGASTEEMSAAASTDARPLTGTAARGLIDEHGRAYARGRRKVSSARVWMVRTKPAAPGAEPPLGEILVNNVPIGTYFSRAAHREAVTWPLKLAGVLGAYNVFALVRGGGASGQAGALAHGLANALVAALEAAPGAHARETADKVRDVLSRDGVLKRDPRMVERKKPGLVKARKAWTWVKR